MPSNFKLDKRALEKVANEAAKKRAGEMQRALDGVHRSHQGKPAAEVEAALSAACRRADMTLDAKQRAEWAQQISGGTRIVFDLKKGRL